MKTVINVIVDNDGYLIAKPGEEGGYVKVMPQGIQRIPCIPFYQSAWVVMGNDVRPAVQDFAQAANLLYGGINRSSALIACPADALAADQIMLRETFEVAGIKKVKIISKTALGEAMRYSDYIAISVSERLLILEWYKDNVVAEAKYYNKAAISKKKLFSDISAIKQKSESKVKILIFDGCNELGGIYGLGKVIDASKMMKLLAIMNEVVFKKRSFKDIFEEEDNKEDADYSETEEQVISRDIVFDEAEDKLDDNDEKVQGADNGDEGKENIAKYVDEVKDVDKAKDVDEAKDVDKHEGADKENTDVSNEK